MKKTLQAAAILTTLLSLCAWSAMASTPDGVTPAEETVCDELRGATPGLYGLCVAYCEAQDCDFEDAISGQCSAPNSKLLDAYERKRQEGDPTMPCLLPEEEEACPCFAADELPELDLVSCDEIDWGFAVDTVLNDTVRASGVLVEVVYDGTGRCMYRDSSDPLNPILSDAETDPTQTAACQSIVNEYVRDTSLTCVYRD